MSFDALDDKRKELIIQCNTKEFWRRLENTLESAQFNKEKIKTLREVIDRVSIEELPAHISPDAALDVTQRYERWLDKKITGLSGALDDYKAAVSVPGADKAELLRTLQAKIMKVSFDSEGDTDYAEIISDFKTLNNSFGMYTSAPNTIAEALGLIPAPRYQ